MSILSIALCVLSAYALVVAVIFLVQRKLQYFPTYDDKAGAGNSSLKPWKNPADGRFLGYVREARGSRPEKVFLVFHGSAGEAMHRAWIEELISKKDAVYFMEYAGYGAKPGSPSERLLCSEAVDLARHLTAVWGKSTPLILVGESLGTGVAAYVASQGYGERLAFISPFSSITDVAKGSYWWLPVDILLKDKFSSVENLANVRLPLHVVHGTQDDVVPIALGRKLFDAYLGPKEFTQIPGVGHGDIDWPLLHSPFCTRFRNFLTEAKAPQPLAPKRVEAAPSAQPSYPFVIPKLAEAVRDH